MNTSYYSQLESRLSTLLSQLPEGLESVEAVAAQNAIRVLKGLASVQIWEIQAYEARHKSM